MNKVKMKPEGDWTSVERRQNPRECKAPLPSPEPETKCSRDCPKQNSKKPEIMNCDKPGGLAKCSEENFINDLTIEHVSNHCSAHFVTHGINCKIGTELFTETIACLTKLNKLSPHQFAQVFKAAGEKKPDVLSHREVQRDHKNLKEWLAAALKEIRQLERKGVWTECLKSKANGEQIIPCTWAF